MKGNKWLKENWLFPVGILAIAIFVYVAVKYKIFAPKVSLPNPEDNAKDGSKVTLTAAQAHNFAMNLHDSFLSGALWFDTNNAINVMNPLRIANDSDLTFIANKFAAAYTGEEYGTVRSLINGEYLGSGTAGVMRDELATRLSQLGL